MILELFKGGLAQSRERAIINQRPADGHLKSAIWEDYIRLSPRVIRDAGYLEALQVGDKIYTHTTLTFGRIHGLGFAVNEAEEGFKMKVICSDDNFDLNAIKVRRYRYDQAQKKYIALDNADVALTAINDIGHQALYYAGYVDPATLMRVDNPVQLGFEILSLPTQGLKEQYQIESRLHMSQVVRPPAYLPCC